MRLQILITVVALFGYEARQFDVSAAYLHGGIDGEADSGATRWRRKWRVCLEILEKTVRTQAGGRTWRDRLKANMQEPGYTQGTRDHITRSSGLEPGKLGIRPCAPLGGR